MEIRDVFSAQPKSIWEYLCENGQGLYVPAYQRPYSWSKEQITRLIEDCTHGFSTLISQKDAITFIGTIIAIHDTELVTVAPIVKGDVPSKVMTIIDGQQRLSTMLLINTVLHEEIILRSKKITHSELDVCNWLNEECLKVTSRLGKTFEEDMTYGDSLYRFYPRMIRAYNDSWSRKKDKAQYSSPIGYYLHSYGNHCRDSGTPKPFKYVPPKQSLEEIAKHESIKNARSIIQGQIRLIARGADKDDEKLEIPTLAAIIQSKILQDSLLKNDLPEVIIEVLKSDNFFEYKELMRLVLFANFVLDRVAITIVTAKNEDYAFDMFESLNTTGEPLTAFETFKPRVIHTEGLESYKESEVYNYVVITESYLECFSKSKEKQDATTKLIIAFALAEAGKKVSKRLSDQRHFLKESYEAHREHKQQKRFVQHLSHTAIFMRDVWHNDNKKLPDLKLIDNNQDAILCLDFLRQINHTVTIGIIVRYYSQVLLANNEFRPKAINDFIEIVKAVTAFSVLWRASRKGTAGIDGIYRDIMNQGYPSIQLPPIARCVNELLPPPKLVKQAFSEILHNPSKGRDRISIGGKEDWVRYVSKEPIYSNQKTVATFVLLAAAHDSSVDKSKAGLLISGKLGLLPLLTPEIWQGKDSQTVEHIAPQTASEGWLTSLYDDIDLIDHLGNLTLLPSIENSMVGNRPWVQKRLIYKILSAETLDEQEPLIQQAQQQGIDFSDSTQNLLMKSRYLPMVRAISMVEGDWTPDLIEQRSIRLAELAWNKIAPWLDLPT